MENVSHIHKYARPAALVIAVVAVVLTANASRCSLRPALALKNATSYGPLVVSPFPASFWFVKPAKVGGSKLAGVLRGVGTRSGVACLTPPVRPRWRNVSDVRVAAAAAHALGFEHTAITNHMPYTPEVGPLLTMPAVASRPPLLFTAVRHPVARVISNYFFTSRYGKQPGPTEEEQQRCADALRTGRPCSVEKLLIGFEDSYVNRDGDKGHNHLFKWLSGEMETPKATYEQYDFVFVTERFDESLVIWALKYGVPLRHVAYRRRSKNRTDYPTKEYMPRAFLDRILRNNGLDEELWTLANSGLDKERSRLETAGHDVDRALQAFAVLQAAVDEECNEIEQWYAERGFGTALARWVKDNGKGYMCIDYAARAAGF